MGYPSPSSLTRSLPWQQMLRCGALLVLLTVLCAWLSVSNAAGEPPMVQGLQAMDIVQTAGAGEPGKPGVPGSPLGIEAEPSHADLFIAAQALPDGAQGSQLRHASPARVWPQRLTRPPHRPPRTA